MMFLVQAQTVVSTKKNVETYKDTNVVRISPLAKRIALEHNIAWQEIQGTGHRGKIMKKDVLAFLPENIEKDYH